MHLMTLETAGVISDSFKNEISCFLIRLLGMRRKCLTDGVYQGFSSGLSSVSILFPRYILMNAKDCQTCVSNPDLSEIQ